MDINALKYSTVSKASALALMKALRPRVVLPDDALRGVRFNCDNHTLWVLESQTTEEQYKEDPVFEVSRALVESARSDHWYAHEKKWDADYGTSDDCEDASWEE